MSSPLSRLREVIVQARELQEVRAGVEALAAELGLRYEDLLLFSPQGQPQPACRLSFDPPVEARWLCEALGWARPYVISPDVHQHSWIIRLWTANLADPYGLRIATEPPLLGLWQVTAWLAGRPSFELPGVAGGASPAYDVWRYSGQVAQLELRLRG